MREINNNAAGLNKTAYPKQQDTKKEQQPVAEQKTEQQAVTTSETLSKSPEAIIGRSQVIDAKAKALQPGEIEKDLKAMEENPELAENYNKTFDKIYNILTKKGDKEAYEKAAMIAAELCG